MGSRDRLTILVVDDDPGLRDALHLVLDDEYDVIDAQNGAQALDILASRDVHLVPLDLLMTGTDGFNVLEQRGRADKTIPIIVLSGLDRAGAAATAMRLGAVDYVTKPFDELVLREIIRAALDPTAQQDRSRVRRASMPLVLLLGPALGVYASLSLLLRGRCVVTRAETVNDALIAPSTRSSSVVVIDMPALGPQSVDAGPRLRACHPHGSFIAIGAGPARAAAWWAGTALEAPTRVTELLGAIEVHLAPDGSTTRRYSARVSSVIDILAAEYAGASLRRLSQAVGSSPDHLSALFREETGVPLKVYVAQLRAEVAKWLLFEAGEKLETIAGRVGLHDASHLSKLFVRYAGTRPGAYRRSARAGAPAQPQIATEAELRGADQRSAKRR